MMTQEPAANTMLYKTDILPTKGLQSECIISSKLTKISIFEMRND